MNLLVTAGPTREYLDAVRYLSNASSGRMGYEVAREGVRRGHRVVLVTGPVALRVPVGARVVRVTSAVEMRDAVLAEAAEADALVMAAAVADFRPRRRLPGKIKKSGRRTLEVGFVRNPDILTEVCRRSRPRVVVGFALEEERVAEEARRKLRAKRLDMIVANTSAAMGAAAAAFRLLGEGFEREVRASKRRLARLILDFVEKRLGETS